MTRIKRGIMARKKKRNLLSKNKGYLLGRSKEVKQAREAFLKAGSYAYRDRKVKKRSFRQLWILRINNACREHGLTYKDLIFGLKNKKIDLDRKILAELCVNHPKVFAKITETVKK